MAALGRDSALGPAAPPSAERRVPSAARVGAATVLALLAAGALVAAAAELAVLGARRFGDGQAIGMGWRIVWMTPLADVLLFALAGLPLLALARRRAGLPIAAAAFLAAALAAASVALLFERIAWYAAAVLAAGVGVQAARLAAAHPLGTARLARRAAWTLGALAIAGGTGTAGWHALRERRALAGLPAAPEGAPNVLLIILDTVRAASLGLYADLYGSDQAPDGTSRALAHIAERGVVFDRAIATAPWTLPSHISLFTGKYPSELEAGWTEPLAEHHLTLAEALSARGYRTGGFVANLAYAAGERGLAQGFHRYEDFTPSAGEIALSSSAARWLATRRPIRRWLGTAELLNRKSAGEVVAAFSEWLGEEAPGPGGAPRPWFAFLNFWDAHVPYLPPEPFASRFGRGGAWTDFQHARNFANWLEPTAMDAGVVARERGAYEGAVAYADEQLLALLVWLGETGELDRTIVVVASDHGEEFMEHGHMSHSFTLYLPSVHVPLVIAGPAGSGVPRGVRVPRVVSLRDIPATVMELVEGAAVGPNPFPGRSLARLWSGAGADKPALGSLALSQVRRMPRAPSGVPAARGTGFMQSLVVEDRYHYIVNGDGTEEVYDVVADPWERENLAAGDVGRAVAARWRASIPAPPAPRPARIPTRPSTR